MTEDFEWGSRNAECGMGKSECGMGKLECGIVKKRIECIVHSVYR